MAIDTTASTSPATHSFRVVILVSALLIVFALLMPSPSSSVSFLDVGQGDAILVQSRSQQLLIDGGQGSSVLLAVAQEMPWFDRTIEVVVNTHPDKDHLEGLVHLLQHYKVALVLLPRVPHSSQLYNEWLTRLQETAAQHATEVRFAHEGQHLLLEDVSVEVLGPVVGEKPRKVNNASVLTRIDFSGMRFLLTGDAEASAERALVARYGSRLKSDVLKAGHHGSKTSTSSDILAAATPATAVISVGADNTYGHPHPTVLERLKGLPILRTDQQGTIRFTHVKERWLLSCGETAWLRSATKPCITQTEE